MFLEGYRELPRLEVDGNLGGLLMPLEPLNVETKRALHSDMSDAANRIVDQLESVPVLERGNWLVHQMRAYADSVKAMEVDRDIVAFHLGMLIGMQMDLE